MIDIETYRNYCISKKGVTEEFPFDNETLVFKVSGKMFALAVISHFNSINLKCDPEEAIDLRERYEAVLPGYHMNKQHWNTILIDGTGILSPSVSTYSPSTPVPKSIGILLAIIFPQLAIYRLYSLKDIR